MKYSKKFISSVIAIMLLSSSLSFAELAISSPKPVKYINMTKTKPIIINDSYTIEEKKSFENSEFFKAYLKYPFLRINKNYKGKLEYKNEFIEKINQDICTYLINFKENTRQQSEKYKQDYENIYSKSGKDYVKYQYEAYSEYKVTYNKYNYLSIPIKTYEFTGGAHGMSYLKSFNYDLSKGQELKLEDCFKEDINYKSVINEFIKEEINKNKEMYFEGDKGFQGISDNQQFYVDEDGIVVYFSLYEIAPYYVGIPEFKMTWDQFGNYFK